MLTENQIEISNVRYKRLSVYHSVIPKHSTSWTWQLLNLLNLLDQLIILSHINYLHKLLLFSLLHVIRIMDYLQFIWNIFSKIRYIKYHYREEKKERKRIRKLFLTQQAMYQILKSNPCCLKSDLAVNPSLYGWK